MYIKSFIFIFCHLAVLFVGNISRRAIANPHSNINSIKPLKTAQWSTPRENTHQTTPQWSNPSQNLPETTPQWSNPSQNLPETTPQWSNPISPPIASPNPIESSFSPLENQAHLVPNAVAPRSTREVIEYPSQYSSQDINPVTEPDRTISEQRNDPSTEQQENSQEPINQETQLPVISDSDTEITAESVASQFTPRDSPLVNQQFIQPTALHLNKGDIVLKLNNRLFFTPGSVETDGTTDFYNLAFSWGITNNLELTFDLQHVDSSFPGRQGEFDVLTVGGDNEGTVEVKQRIWQNSSQTQALSGVVSLSFPLADRGSLFRQNSQTVLDEQRQDFVPALQIPLTTSISDRLQLTFSPTVAFFPEESALFLRRPPTNNSDSFGTTFGFAGAISYNLSPRLTLWGDAFVPVTGNNSVSRDSGQPAKTVAFNAGFRYLVNPRLAVDVFASNTLGSTGALALTADPGFTSLGASVVFMPDLISGNRRYPDSFDLELKGEDSPITTDGLAFFDGGTIPSGKFLFNLQGGSQGVLTSLRYGLLKDLEVGIFLDYVSSDVDESEQGVSGKIRVLNQAQGDPLTASLAATFSLTNQPFINFINNNRNEFDNRNLDKDVPFFFPGQDDAPEGKLFIVTLSLPLHYQFDNGAALWATPIVGFVQRNGVEVAGVNVGGSFPVLQDISLVGEVGANFVDAGNSFVGNNRENVIPWTVAIRWDSSRFLGIDSNSTNRPQLELYVTNRVGSSTWHQLRVRDQNETAVGVGVFIPF